MTLFSSLVSISKDYNENRQQREYEKEIETFSHIIPVVGPHSELDDKKISRVQLLLNYSGISLYPKVSVSGKYDDATEKAIKKIQKEEGLPQTAIVDSKMYTILEKYAGLKRKDNSCSLHYNRDWNIVYRDTKGSTISEIFKIRQAQNKSYITGDIIGTNAKATFYGSINDKDKKIAMMSTKKSGDYVCFYAGEIKEGFMEGTCECYGAFSKGYKGQWTMVKN